MEVVRGGSIIFLKYLIFPFGKTRAPLGTGYRGERALLRHGRARTGTFLGSFSIYSDESGG